MSPDDELHLALLMWGRWARSDHGPDGYTPPPIFSQWMPSQWWKDAGEDSLVAVEERETEPDEAECMALDRVITGLQARHRRWLTTRYVLLQYVDEMMLYAALRALGDKL